VRPAVPARHRTGIVMAALGWRNATVSGCLPLETQTPTRPSCFWRGRIVWTTGWRSIQLGTTYIISASDHVQLLGIIISADLSLDRQASAVNATSFSSFKAATAVVGN